MYQNYEEEQQQQQQDDFHSNRILAEMNAMDARLVEWHADEDVRNQFRGRLAMINNRHGYHTGNRVLQCRTTQMYDPEDWSLLFGYENILPEVEAYAQKCMRYEGDQEHQRSYGQERDGAGPFSGNLEISLLMEENPFPERPGVHLAVFIVYITPHQQFHDGHIIQMEIGDGSLTHYTINRLFDIRTRAILQQLTEYQILSFLAEANEMTSVLWDLFLPGFNPMRFDDADADVLRRRHECHNVVNVVLHGGVDPVANADVVIQPADDFAAYYYAEDDNDNDNDNESDNEYNSDSDRDGDDDEI